MTEPNDEREQVRAAVNEAIDQALRMAQDAVNGESDLQQAVEEAAYYSTRLREASEQLGELRAHKAAAIWQRDQLSLAGLANRLGVSRTRAHQFVQTSKETRGPSTDD